MARLVGEVSKGQYTPTNVVSSDGEHYHLSPTFSLQGKTICGKSATPLYSSWGHHPIVALPFCKECHRRSGSPGEVPT